MEAILNESIEAVNFEVLIENAADKYIEYCDYLDKYLSDNHLNTEKHLKHYSNNLSEFRKNNKQKVFLFFLKNMFLNMNYIVDNNVDYFLTQKPYILKKTKKTKKKIPNQKATYLVPGNLLRYFIFVLNESPKDGKVSRNKDIKHLFTEITNIMRLFENNLDELKSFIEKNFKSENTRRRFNVVIDNYNKIINEEEEEIEVSSEEEEEDKKESEESSNSDMGSLFSESFIENSTIGKLAKEISESFSEGDLGSLLGGLNQTDASGNNTNEAVNKIKNKIDSKMKDGSIQLDKIGGEIMQVMNSLSNMTGGGEGGNGQFNIMNMVQGMMGSMAGGSNNGTPNFMDLFKNMQSK